MSLTDTINTDIKEAMKAKDKDRLTALRGIKSKLLLEATKDGSSDEISEDAGMKIIMKLHKQHMDSADIYREQNREDLLAEELAQAKVIEAYLPQQMSADELAAGVKELIAELGASSMADMGRVMGAASKKFAGKADGKAISTHVKSLLAG